MIAPLLLAFDFMNFTYLANPCSQNVPVPVVMKKGAFSYFDAKMGQGFDVFVDSVQEGSLQPGTRQAVVVLKCQFPLGGTAAAYVFDERNSSPVLLGEVGTANWGADWGAPPSSIRVRFAKGFLRVRHCQNDACKQYVATTYALRNGKLTTISTTVSDALSVRK